MNIDIKEIFFKFQYIIKIKLTLIFLKLNGNIYYGLYY